MPSVLLDIADSRLLSFPVCTKKGFAIAIFVFFEEGWPRRSCHLTGAFGFADEEDLEEAAVPLSC